jgi:hypothetical protein
MVGYLSKFRFAELCVLTDEPDFSDIEVVECDWSKSVYGNASEAVPKDTPEPVLTSICSCLDCSLLLGIPVDRVLVQEMKNGSDGSACNDIMIQVCILVVCRCDGFT